MQINGERITEWGQARKALETLAKEARLESAEKIERIERGLEVDVFTADKMDSVGVDDRVKLTAFWLRLVKTLGNGNPTSLGRSVGEALARISELELDGEAQARFEDFMNGTVSGGKHEKGLPANIDVQFGTLHSMLPADSRRGAGRSDDILKLVPRGRELSRIPESVPDIGGKLIESMWIESDFRGQYFTLNLDLRERGEINLGERPIGRRYALDQLGVGDLERLRDALNAAVKNVDPLMSAASGRSVSEIAKARLAVEAALEKKADVPMQKLKDLSLVGWVERPRPQSQRPSSHEELQGLRDGEPGPRKERRGKYYQGGGAAHDVRSVADRGPLS